MIKASNLAMKECALNLMSIMGFSPRYYRQFGKDDKINVFDTELNGTVISPGSELWRRIKAVEQDSGVKVFAVTRDFFEGFGEMYSLLCVSPYEEDWDVMFRPVGHLRFRSYAYVWNLTNDDYSEFGSVYVEAYNGGIRRVG